MSVPAARSSARSRWAVLLAGVLAALGTAGLWLLAARHDSVPAETQVPAGATGTSAGGTWRLLDLQRAATIPGDFGQDEPVSGATFVVATLEADLSGADPAATCTFTLVVGELRIREDASVEYPAPGTICARRGDEPVRAVFEVPSKRLGDVTAVTIATGVGERLRLTGTLG